MKAYWESGGIVLRIFNIVNIAKIGRLQWT
jgi:hypothetical protein